MRIQSLLLALSVLILGFAGHPSARQSTRQPPLTRDITIIGTNGSLAVPTMRVRYYENKEERSWWKPLQTRVIALERLDPLAEQIEHFAAVIRGETKPRVTARDGLQNLRVTEAIAEAATSGRIVKTN